MLAFACMIVTCAGLCVPCLWLRYIEGVEKKLLQQPTTQGAFQCAACKNLQDNEH